MFCGNGLGRDVRSGGVSALDLSPENAPAVSLPSLTVVEPSEDDERALASLLDGEAARVVLHTQADLLGGGQVAAPPSSDSALRESAGTLQLQEDLTKVYPEKKGAHWDPKRHPRWPKGTPGGKGGRWMRVGERFLFKGVEYDITYVGPGELYAHVATKGTKNVPDTVHFTMKQETAKAAGYSDEELKAAGLKPEDKVDVFAGVERPPAEPIKASKKTESTSFTGTVLDPYVHPETHDPSIPIPKGAEDRISPEEWERFGAIDQKRFSQLMELYGVWSSGDVKTRMSKAKQNIDPAIVELLEEVYGHQYGGSSGMTISLHSIYAGVLDQPAGSQAVEKARDRFEEAKAAQDELVGLIQWDLYNRVRGPDIAMFHKSGYIGEMHEPPWWQENMIDGNKPIFAGLSQSQSYSAIGGHKPVVATPMAIRHVVFSTLSGNIVNKYAEEWEVAVGDAYMADSNTRVWWYADSSGSGDLTKTQDDYLKKTTKNGASGEVLKLGVRVD